MECSWSTLLNPCNVLRALWNLAEQCWRGLGAFCARTTRSSHAPTEEAMAIFEPRPTRNVAPLQRNLYLKVHQGLLSPSQDSDNSQQSPRSIHEIVSHTLHNFGPLSAEHNETDSERMPCKELSDQIQQGTPLYRRESQKFHERPSTFHSAGANQASNSSEKSYRTF